jgi:nitrite reductase/ring-hydroxylating ferredoxin subunit
VVWDANVSLPADMILTEDGNLTDIGKTADQTTQQARLGFNDLLLGAVVVLMGTGTLMALAFYVLPGEHLEIPEIQPGVRVTREADFPVSASRLVSWGEQTILVVRSGEQSYAALQGTSPRDGCILRWDEESMRIVSPCNHVVFDLQGNVVTGLSTTPLQRYSVFLRGGVVYVGRPS